MHMRFGIASRIITLVQETPAGSNSGRRAASNTVVAGSNAAQASSDSPLSQQARTAGIQRTPAPANDGRPALQTARREVPDVASC